jgi:hypothetical protein
MNDAKQPQITTDTTILDQLALVLHQLDELERRLTVVENTRGNPLTGRPVHTMLARDNNS